MNVQAGTLGLDAGGAQSSSFTVASGATLQLNQTHRFNAAADIGGGGTLNMQGGGLTGSGDVTVTVTFNWTGGTMSGAGTTIIPSGGVLNISGGCNLHRVLENNGTAAWKAGTLAMNAGTFNNNGSFTAQSSTSLDSYGTGGVSAFNNAARLSSRARVRPVSEPLAPAGWLSTTAVRLRCKPGRWAWMQAARRAAHSRLPAARRCDLIRRTRSVPPLPLAARVPFKWQGNSDL